MKRTFALMGALVALSPLIAAERIALAPKMPVQHVDTVVFEEPPLPWATVGAKAKPAAEDPEGSSEAPATSAEKTAGNDTSADSVRATATSGN